MFAFPNGEMPQAAMDKRTAAASVDAYFEANLLRRGRAATYEVLQEARAQNCHFRWTPCLCTANGGSGGMPGRWASTRLCNHSWSSHAWYETGSKHIRC